MSIFWMVSMNFSFVVKPSESRDQNNIATTNSKFGLEHLG